MFVRAVKRYDEINYRINFVLKKKKIGYNPLAHLTYHVLFCLEGFLHTAFTRISDIR